MTVCKGFDGSVSSAARSGASGRAVARRRRGGGGGGRREDGSAASGGGQGGAAVAARLQAGAGPSLAAGVEAGRNGRCSIRRRRRRGPVTKGDISTFDKRGHFYFALAHAQRGRAIPLSGKGVTGACSAAHFGEHFVSECQAGPRGAAVDPAAGKPAPVAGTRSRQKNGPAQRGFTPNIDSAKFHACGLCFIWYIAVWRQRLYQSQRPHFFSHIVSVRRGAVPGSSIPGHLSLWFSFTDGEPELHATWARKPHVCRAERTLQ